MLFEYNAFANCNIGSFLHRLKFQFNVNHTARYGIVLLMGFQLIQIILQTMFLLNILTFLIFS